MHKYALEIKEFRKEHRDTSLCLNRPFKSPSLLQQHYLYDRKAKAKRLSTRAQEKALLEKKIFKLQDVKKVCRTFTKQLVFKNQGFPMNAIKLRSIYSVDSDNTYSFIPFFFFFILNTQVIPTFEFGCLQLKSLINKLCLVYIARA